MKGLLTAAGALVLGAFLAAPAAAQPASGLISAEHAREEIGLAVRVVTGLHPGAFRHIGRDDFAALSGRLKDAVDGPQTREQMFLHLSRVLGAVCDEHTQVHDFDVDAAIEAITSARSDGDAAPDLAVTAGLAMNLLVLEGRLLVAPGSGELPVGGEIVAIDGRPAGELIGLLLERLPIDGCAAVRKVTAIGISGQEILGAILGAGPTYQVEVRAPGGAEAKTYEVRAISAGEMLPGNHPEKGPPRADLSRMGFSTVEAEEGLLLAFDSRRRIAYLAIQSFFDPSNAAVAHVMHRMLRLGARRLLLDLEDNTGGRVDVMRRAVSFLLPSAHRFSDVYELRSLTLPEPGYFHFAKGKDAQFARDVRQFARGRHAGDLYILPGGNRAYGNPNFKGKVTVLVNELTGSAAAVAAFILKDQLGAELVGTETHAGAAYTCGRPLGSYLMPYSGLRLYVPHACARRNGELARAYRRTITPDVEVLPRPADLAAHRLEVIKAALAQSGEAG